MRNPAVQSAVVDAVRGLAAGGVLLSAAIHLDLWDTERFRLIPTIGPLFLLNVIGGGVLGLLMLAWRHWLPALAAAGYGAATVGAFWISVEHGLFGFQEIGTGSVQLLSQIAEYIAIVFGLAAAAALWRGRRRRTVAAGVRSGHGGQTGGTVSADGRTVRAT
jgi:hypothetical protein